MDDDQLPVDPVLETPTDDAASDITGAVDHEPADDAAPDDGQAAAAGQAAAEAAGFTSIRDYLASKRYDASRYQTDEEAIEDLLSAHRQAQQAQQDARYWQQQAQRAQQMQPPPQPQPPANKPRKEYWSKPPEFDPAWRQLLKTDEQGNIVAVPGAAPDLPQKYQAYVRWQQDQQAKLLADPVEAIWPGLEERLEQVLSQREQQLMQKYQQDYEARSYLQQMMPYLFARDEQGQPLVDPRTGQEALTPYGQAFTHYLQESKQITNDPAARRHYAESMARAYVTQQQAALPQQQAAPPVDHKANYTAQPTRRAPNRGGTVETSRTNRVAQNSEMDLHNMLTQAFKKQGLLQSSTI